MKRIAVLCSGGDAPGMNAAIRSVVRYGLVEGVEVIGVKRGYSGLLEGLFEPMQLSSVANLIQKGGTFLLTSRCKEFRKKEGRKKAAEVLRKEKVDGLVVLGGDGSFQGGHLLAEEHGISVAGVPCTIDNDVFGTDDTIGFDTAINTALDAIDRIRDSASSHERTFMVEVMGRSSPFIATHVGIGGGAETICTPEEGNLVNIEGMIETLQYSMKRGKGSSIIVIAEGARPGRSYEIAEELKKKGGIDAKVAILGHIQRGGSPTARDRWLASLSGVEAVRALLRGEKETMIATDQGRVTTKKLSICFDREKPFSQELLKIAHALSR